MKTPFMLTLIFFSVAVHGQQLVPSGDYVQGQVVIKLKDNITVANHDVKRNRTGVAAKLDRYIADKGVRKIDRLFDESGPLVAMARERGGSRRLENVFVVTLGKELGQMQTMLDELKKMPEVEYAEPNYFFRVDHTLSNEDSKANMLRAYPRTRSSSVTPSDPFFSSQQNLVAANIPRAWDVIKGDSSVVIGVLDTGVDWEHPDLQGNTWRNLAEWNGKPGVDDDGNGLVDDIRGWDWINNDNNPTDDNSHGTHVAGIIAARGNNGIGISGVNWYGKVMCLKVIQSTGRGDAVTIAKGIEYAVAKGAKVLNMSFGGYFESLALKEALENAYAKAFLVAAAGNDGKCIGPGVLCAPMYPAAYSYVMGVQDRALYSNIDQDGPFVSRYPDLLNYEVFAPGSSVTSLVPRGGYKSYTGTSMSTPLVSGLVSLYMGLNKTYDKEFIFGNLIHSADDFIDGFKFLTEKGKPDIIISKYEIVDDCATCDNDGKPDAGETMNLRLFIKNTWASGDGVSVKLLYDSLADQSLVSFIDNSANVGSIAPNATAFTITPTRIKISDKVNHGADYKVRVRINDNKGNSWVSVVVLNFENAVTFGGFISTNTTLYANKYYYVTENTVLDNCVLTIKPGVVLNFARGKSLLVNKNARVIAEGKKDSLISFTSNEGWAGIRHEDFDPLLPNTFYKYCLFENMTTSNAGDQNFDPLVGGYFENSRIQGSYCSMIGGGNAVFVKSNFVGNRVYWGLLGHYLSDYNNYYNSPEYYGYEHFSGIVETYYNFSIDLQKKNINSINNEVCDYRASFGTGTYSMPLRFYLGTDDSLAMTKRVYDYFDDQGLKAVNLSNFRKTPFAEAPGLVWKLTINGKDLASNRARTEDVLDLGVHELKVWFNRKMDTTVAPVISFGQRAPFNQVPVTKKGVWSTDGKTYTVKRDFTITDPRGIVTFAISRAMDDMGMEIPEEKTRFRVNLQSTCSRSLDFGAASLCGKIALDWENLRTTGSDIIGYNLYRRKRISTNAFSEYELINKELVLENSYVDYKVSLDTTYEYVYTVVRGGLGNESDSSYTVSGKPLASKLGDSNGDSSVSVLDVVTAVNYIMERDPAPFIYRQTDMNNDAGINVLDIVGIIDRILNPRAGSVVSDYDYNSLLFAGEVSLYRVGDTVFGRSSQPIAGIETRESEVQEWVGEVNRWERIGKPGKDAGSMVFGFNNNLDASVDKAIAVIQKKSDPARWLFSAPSGQPLKVNWMGTPAVNRDRISNELSLSGVYPNPTDGHCRLTIEVHGLQVDNIVVRVIDATGRNVYVLPLGSRSKGLYQQDLNLGKLPKGSYVIQTSWSMGEQSHMRNEKIVVQ